MILKMATFQVKES